MTKSVGPWGIVHSVSRRQRRRSWASSPAASVFIVVGFVGGACLAPFSPQIGGGLLAMSAVMSSLAVIDLFSR